MDEGTLEFVARHKEWTGAYRTKMRPTDEPGKFIAFATIVDMEIERKMPDFLVALGVDKKRIEHAIGTAEMALNPEIGAAIKKAVKGVHEDVKGTVAAYIMRNALVAKGVPFRYDVSKIKSSRPSGAAGRISFVAKHKLWDKVIQFDIKETDQLHKLVAVAASLDDEITLKIPALLKEMGVNISSFDGIISKVKDSIDPNLGKGMVDALFEVPTEIREIAAAYAVREALVSKKLPYNYMKGTIKKLIKHL